MEWHRYPVKKVLEHFSVQPETGLEPRQAKERMREYGANEFQRKSSLRVVRMFLRQFKSPLIYILFVAGGITLFLGETLDTLVIGAALGINAVVGFFQEYKASAAFDQLRETVRHSALVRRSGKEFQVDSSEVVPGDILILGAGDRVAADGRLLSVRNLQVDEAQLTGESVPVYKQTSPVEKTVSVGDKTNMVFMGTTVQQGRAEAVVTATGEETELGKIAQLVETSERTLTPFQLHVKRLSQLIGMLVIGATLLIFLAGLISGTYAGEEVFVTAVAIAVAAIPEGLPVALTVVLAIAATRILRKNGLIRRLVASETLGSSDVIATDKTGTLTRGTMVLQETVSYFEKRPAFLEDIKADPLLTLAGLSADVVQQEDGELVGSATDRAVIEGLAQEELDIWQLRTRKSRIAQLPFTTERKYLLSVWQWSAETSMAVVSGAPEKLLEAAQVTDNKKQEILSKVEEMAQEGLRVIGVGYRNIPPRVAEQVSEYTDQDLAGLLEGIEFIGLLALEDPLRVEAEEAIQEARGAGVRTVMVTGDHPLTAKAIGRRLGLRDDTNSVLTGRDLEAISVEALERQLEEIDIYARVNPEHKLKIIQAWQRRGSVVAMTGDGVNDAPALKKADIGVAVGSGTEVAKEAADLVLLDDNFATIVESIRQGRTAFNNMKKTALYLLADSFSEVALILGSILLGLPLPILAAQILWINLVNDVFPSLAFAFEPPEKYVMRQKPRSKSAGIFDRFEGSLFVFISVITGVAFLGLFWWSLQSGKELTELRTLIFAGIGLAALLYALPVKALRRPLWRSNLLDNKALIAGIGAGITTMLAGIYLPPLQAILRTVPLMGQDWLIIGGFAIGLIMVVEVAKWVLEWKAGFDSM